MNRPTVSTVPTATVPTATPRLARRRTPVLAVGRLRSAILLAAVSAVGLALFTWPLFAQPDSELAHSADAPLLFAVVLALLVVVLASELMGGGMDAKALAMLGVLAAVAAALRPLGGGLSGFQPMFVVLIVGGRALGPGFGFCLGLVAMFGSALITGGVGPWLPFQMLGAGWVGLGAGLLPRLRGRGEVTLLAAYGAVSGIAYGFLLNMWFWPFMTGADAAISFEAGAPLLENLARFAVFCLLTSLGYDIPRAVANIVLIALAAGPMLHAIRRASARANFAAAPQFVAPLPEPSPRGPERSPGAPERSRGAPERSRGAATGR